MAPIPSYIWMLSHQGVELFKRIRRIMRYGLIGVCVALSEKAYH